MAVRPTVQRSHLEPSHAPRFRRHLPRLGKVRFHVQLFPGYRHPPAYCRSTV
ncbi:hypothetical protein BC827DRAFT_1238287, partial [Russula dissimulans]